MSTLRVIPLGGLGEFGMNMMVYELPGSAIIVDCGMMFPDVSVLGVDVLIPDMSYVESIRDKVRGIFLTHGHEDHIGALPFLSDVVDAPVWGMPLALGFVRGRLDEIRPDSSVDLRTLELREPVEAGEFIVEPMHVTHSIVDSVALAITTPVGTIVHTGDFKLDHTPVDSRPTDVGRFAEHGQNGVVLLVSDSTNSTNEGCCGSERRVGEKFRELFSSAPGRILLTTFASHIHRIQQIADLALESGRTLHLLGRSLMRTVEIAERLGHLHIPREVRSRNGRAGEIEDRNAVIVCTGSQGEPASALARIARDEHRGVTIAPDDTVVISARTIPGNERAIMHVIDHLLRRGARVVYEEKGTHVSGHGFREELETMILLTKPRYFIPMHGTLWNLVNHAEVAKEVGIHPDDVFVATNGQVVEIGSDGGRILEERVPAGKVFVDEVFEELPSLVVRDRKHLGEDGFVIVVAAVDLNTGGLTREPEIITRGVVHVDASAEILDELRDLLVETIARIPVGDRHNIEGIQEAMRAVLKRYFRKKLSRRPMILPVVWEM